MNVVWLNDLPNTLFVLSFQQLHCISMFLHVILTESEFLLLKKNSIVDLNVNTRP